MWASEKGGLFRKPEKVKDLFIHNSCLCLNTCGLQDTGRSWLEYQVARVYNTIAWAMGTPHWLTLMGAPFIHHREQTPKSWSAASLEANQMLSVLSNRFGWADSRSRTVRRFSANFKCGGEARTERSPGKRILCLNHRLKISTGDDPIRWDCLLHNLPQQGSTGFISQRCPDSLSTDSCRGTPLQVQTAHQRILLNTPTLGHP